MTTRDKAQRLIDAYEGMLAILPMMAGSEDAMSHSVDVCRAYLADQENSDLVDLRRQIENLKASNALYRSKALDEFWCWQGDGSDHLESLVCPVLIPAEELRRLIQEKKNAS